MADIEERLAEIRRHAEEVHGWTEMPDDASAVLVDARYDRKPTVPPDVPLGMLMLGADVLWLLGAYDTTSMPCACRETGPLLVGHYDDCYVFRAHMMAHQLPGGGYE